MPERKDPFAHVSFERLGARIMAIEEAKDDPEAAHMLEDRLRTDILVAIADGAPNPKVLAICALRTAEIEFERWPL